MLLRALLFSTAFIFQAVAQETYVIQTFAGTGAVGDGGAATAAILSQPEGIAVDHNGNVYISDADGNRVRKVASNGTISTVAGNGLAGYSGDGGPGALAELAHPYGIAVDSSGVLYIADLGNAVVRKVTSDGNISTFAGGGSTVPGNSLAGLPAHTVQLSAPRNLAIDSSGNVYISDFGANQVYSVSPGGILNTVAGTGKAGVLGDGSVAVLAQVSAPAGLAIDTSGVLYIADSGNNRIRAVSHGMISSILTITGPTGLAVNSSGTLYIAANGYFGTATHTLGLGLAAHDVAADPAGNVYVTEPGIVQKLTTNNALVTVAGCGASLYYGGDGGPAASARLHSPSSVARDDLGNLYIADTANHRIREISAAGIVSTIAGTGEPGSAGDNGPAMLAQLNGPTAVVVDSHGNLYVADTGNNSIRKITPAGGISTVLGQLSGPGALAIDGSDTLYIADTGNNRVLKQPFGAAATMLTQAVKPAGLAIDVNGNLYISESTRVSQVSNTGIYSTVLAGANAPGGLATTVDGSLIIAETGANRIRMLTNGAAFTIAGVGAAGFSGDGGPAMQAQLSAPAGVAVNLDGTIWIADAGNNRIRTLSPTSGSSTAPASLVTPATLQTASLVNAASLTGGSVAPGEIVSIFGSGFDAKNSQVLFDSQQATIFYASATQINALAPAALKPGTTTNVTVNVGGTAVAGLSVPVAAAAPGIFAAPGGQVAATNEDGSYNSASNPAARGSVVTFYATGDGGLGASGVTVGAYAATVLFSGPAPGFPGLMQVNARIPAGFLPPGIQPLGLWVGNKASQTGVTIAVK